MVINTVFWHPCLTCDGRDCVKKICIVIHACNDNWNLVLSVFGKGLPAQDLCRV